MGDRLERVLEWLRELRDHYDDSYWMAAHPEVSLTLAAFLTGLVGLLFAWLEVRMRLFYNDPR